MPVPGGPGGMIPPQMGPGPGQQMMNPGQAQYSSPLNPMQGHGM